MTAPALTSASPLTMAAAQLLLAARGAGRCEFTTDDADRLLHRSLRFSHRGVDCRIVTPGDAVDELVSAGLVDRSGDGWIIQ